jgi:GTP-binding protein HflX
MISDKKNAILVSLKDDVVEIKQLAESLDYVIVETFIQHRTAPDVSSYIGSGKVDEIKEYIDRYDEVISLIIIDGKIKPSQWFILEKRLNVEVYDRLRLILSIFRIRADRKEAKLQVKLAELEYEKPYVRELIHRSRSGEHPGLMAGGEYQVDDYFEMIKKQMKKVKGDLKKIRDGREIHRRHRRISGYYMVSLAGYTNAGKSSLLNILSGEQVKVEEKLFSTLSTITRKIKDEKIPILLTDTVGFIQDLPAWIIDAFHSTLEEIELADVVLLVVDSSDDILLFEKKLKTSLDELSEIGAKSSIIVVLNKIDLLSNDQLDFKIKFLKDLKLSNFHKIVSISVKNNLNIDLLLDAIYNLLPNLVRFEISLPVNKKSHSFVSWIYDKCNVIDISYNKSIKLDIECNIKIKNMIISRCKDLGGKFFE